MGGAAGTDMDTESMSRYPALAQMQRQALQVRRAEERLDAEWAPMRRLITGASIPLLALPLAAFVAQAIARASGDGAPFFLAGLATLIGVPALVNLGARGVQAWLKRGAKVDPVWLQTLDRCAELGTLPDDVAAPLDRALDAYVTMRRLAQDSAWRRARLPASDFVQRAGVRVQELLEWGRRLQFIGSRLRQLPGNADAHPEHRETLAQYRLQCENLSRAADIFSQAEAKMTRAYAALSGDHSLGSVAADQFQDITATFDALAEIAAPPEDWTQPRAAAAPEEKVAHIRLGGSDRG